MKVKHVKDNREEILNKKVARLQNQIDLLKLENSYLKSLIGGDQNASGSKREEDSRKEIGQGSWPQQDQGDG